MGFAVQDLSLSPGGAFVDSIKVDFEASVTKSFRVRSRDKITPMIAISELGILFGNTDGNLKLADLQAAEQTSVETIDLNFRSGRAGPSVTDYLINVVRREWHEESPGFQLRKRGLYLRYEVADK